MNDRTKRMARTLVRIVDIQDDISKVIVPSWDWTQEVSIPTSKIPIEHQDNFHNGNIRCIAWVNTGAEEAEQLQFENWEVAPEPIPESYFDESPGKFSG
jgi:hypothetical protein